MKWLWPLLALALLLPPARLQVSTARGVTTIPLVQDPADGALIPLPLLARSLGATLQADGEWQVLSFRTSAFRFLPGTSVVSDGTDWLSLPAPTQERRDTLLVPLAFVSDVLADPARGAWRWNAQTTLLTEIPVPSPLAQKAAPKVVRHRVTIDPGHGGVDSGNRGFASGTWEKDVTLAVGLLLRDELKKRGVDVVMTRTRDTLINLVHRAPRYCGSDCDLFVSLHVNSLDPKARGYALTRGFETFFLAEATTADAERVARMENASLRYDPPETATKGFGDLGFTLRDLQTNEFLRQSAKFADMVQGRLKEVHGGTNRGVKQANFAVLRTARSPAVLVEMGFSTNRADAQMMTTPTGQSTLALSIASAIVDYLADLDRNMGAGGPP